MGHLSDFTTLKIIIGQSVFVYLTLSLSLYLCICLFVFVFYSLGCIRTWGQTEEPNTEPFAMDKETSQELRMLSSVTINCQVTKIVINSGSQLSEF